MATATMDFSSTWNNRLENHCFIDNIFVGSSDHLRLLMEKDMADYYGIEKEFDFSNLESSLYPEYSEPMPFKTSQFYDEDLDLLVDPETALTPQDVELLLNNNAKSSVLSPDDDEWVDSETGLLTDADSTLPVEIDCQSLAPSYHPNQDHDYASIKKDAAGEEVSTASNESNSTTVEPVVEVWEIENFGSPETAASEPTSECVPGNHQTSKRESRRTSSRKSEMKRSQQARQFSNAVHAVLRRPQRTQPKNNRPKNSVETTPSQSDIEELYSQPIRPNNTRVTKKKTSKGRVDHSESERQRREVLRRNFSVLCDSIPHQFLKGEKASSQISKQKILNGAKAFLMKLDSSNSLYKLAHQSNNCLQDKHQKSLSKLLKHLKIARRRN